MNHSPFPPSRRATVSRRVALVGFLTVGGALVGPPLAASGPAASRPTAGQPRSATIRDSQVLPAGAAVCHSGQCAAGRCGHAVGRGHLGGCRHGHCAPNCPVRPDSFGYYGTRWRRWPGTSVVQASAVDAAMPAPPPRSAIPGVDEESPDAGGAKAGDDNDETVPSAVPEDAAQSLLLPDEPAGERDEPRPARGTPARVGEDQTTTSGWRRFLPEGSVVPTVFSRAVPPGR